MTQYLTLLKVMMKLGKNTDGKKKSSQAGMIVGLSVAALAFVAMFIVFGVMFGQMVRGTGAEGAMFTIALTAVEGLLLIFAIIFLLSVMYFSKDNEFLLSLPVKNGTIFLVKLTLVYVYLLAIGALFILPLGISFGAAAQLPGGFYAVLLLAMILVPLAPIFVGTLLSFPIMYIVSFIRSNRIVTTILIVAVVAAFAGLYIWLYGGVFKSGEADPGSGSSDSGIPTISQEAVEDLNRVSKYLFFNRCFAGIGIGSENIGADIGTLLGSYVAFAGLSYLLSVGLYRRGMSRQLESGGETIGKDREFKVNSPRRALFLKEMKTVLRTPALFMYALMEIAMPVVFMAIFGNQLTALSEMQAPVQVKAIIDSLKLCAALLFGLLFAFSMNYVALTSVSREGKNFYLMRIMPITIAEQMEVKGLFALIFPILSILAVSVYMMCIGAVTVFSGIMYFVFLSILCYGFTFFQVGMDIKRPRLDYDNFTQMAKNNTNALVCMGISFLFAVVTCGLVIGFIFLSFYMPNRIVAEIVMWAVLLVLAGIASYVMRKSYLKSSVIRFEEIEA